MDIKTFKARLKHIKTLNPNNSSFINKDLYKLVISESALLDGYKKTKKSKTFTASSTYQYFFFKHVPFKEKLEVLRQSLLDESWQPNVLKKQAHSRAKTKERTKKKTSRARSSIFDETSSGWERSANLGRDSDAIYS